MKQKYKITFTLATFICFVATFYFTPSARHWFYYRMTDVIVSKSTPSKVLKDINLNDFLLLDSRNREEYKVSHLPNSIWIGDDDLFWNRLPKTNNKPLLVYCSIGYRSSIVGKKIIDSLGFEVYNLEYGIFNYNYNKKPLIDSLSKPTTKVHPFSSFWGLFVN